MRAFDQGPSAWLDAQLFDRLHYLEGRHQRIQSEHDAARRRLERSSPENAGELRDAWRCYCEVIAELEHATVEIEILCARAG
jgi:hypothetical protein